jgi:hypothetical protein
MTGQTSSSHAHRVGLLVVHGIGEKKRFETADALARSLAGTLAARDKAPRFALIDRTSQRTAEELVCPSANPSDSPYEIVVAGDAGGRTHIHIHEVWWADLGVSDSLSDQGRFWIWALGQWRARINRVTHLAGGSNTDLLMVGPKFARQVSTDSEAPRRSIFWVRLLLAAWGVAAFLTFFSWNVVKQVLSWISPYIGSSSLITQYVGHVRVYTQDQPPGGGSLVDVGQPWRATIRRRMVAECVAMAERDYDRWYLLGHSQGSVLAFNAVQETEWCLPNYLQPAQAERLRKTALWTHAPYIPPPHSHAPDLDHMMPRRPVWLERDEGVSREHLFARFRGLLTYGSPLDKFATLWPRIVSLNKQRDVFPHQADWVNLWDATDPIGACLTAFSDPDTAWPKGGPANVHVRASPLFLYSHIRYLQPERATAQRDTNALLDEVLPASGDPPGLRQAFLKLPGGRDAQLGRQALAKFEVAVLAVALALGAGLLAYAAKGLVGALFAQLPAPAPVLWQETVAAVAHLFGHGYFGAVRFVVALAVATVVACGFIRWVLEPGVAVPPTRPSASVTPPAP